MVDPKDPLVQLKVTSATCSFVALGSTLYRLYKRRGRYWVDDHWALFAFVALIMQVVAVFLHVPLPNRFSKTTRVAAYYLMATTFYAVIWGSRLSILFSIVRIDPSTQRRKRLSWVAVAFVAVLIFLLAQLFWVCEPDPSWKSAPNPQCRLTLQVAVSQLITDILADSILLCAPLPLFWNLFDQGLRRKLMLIFSTCVVTTVVSLVHAAFILRNGGIKVVISALVEDCLSLIVANIPVVVTTMVDIVGDADQAWATRTTPFSTVIWYHGTETGTNSRGMPTEGAIAMLDSPTDDMELSETKSSKSTWNQNEQPDSEQVIVDKVSSTPPMIDRRSYPYPTSPL